VLQIKPELYNQRTGFFILKIFLAFQRFARIVSGMNSNLDRYIPTQEERWESLDLASLVALLGGTVTREFSPLAPESKEYVFATVNGLEIARVTYTQEMCFFYDSRMFQNGQWIQSAVFGEMQCIEVELYDFFSR